MIPLDELVPNYRRARDRWSGAPTLAVHYDAVAEAYAGCRQSLIECAKSYVECVCRTILNDYGRTPEGNPSTTGLLVCALDCLGLRSTRGAARFDSVLSAHNKLADALTDARNHDAPIAHGKDGFLDALADHHVRLYLLTGDTILSLLLGAIEGSEPNLIHTRERYGRFDHLNTLIDAAVSIEAAIDLDDGMVVLGFRTPGLSEGFELRFQPSKLLYELDREAYVEVLKSLPRALDIEVAERESPQGGTHISEFTPANPAPVQTKIVKTYSGSFAALRGELTSFLSSQGLRKADVDRLPDSLLAAFDDAAVPDWAVREPMRARVLVAFKRVLRELGPRHSPPENFAGQLVQWFVENDKRMVSPAGKTRSRTSEKESDHD